MSHEFGDKPFTMEAWVTLDSPPQPADDHQWKWFNVQRQPAAYSYIVHDQEVIDGVHFVRMTAFDDNGVAWRTLVRSDLVRG